MRVRAIPVLTALLLSALLIASSALAQPYVYVVTQEAVANPDSASPPTTGLFVQVRNGRTFGLLSSLQLGLSQTAVELMLGPEDRRAYVATSHGLYIVDAASNTLVKTLQGGVSGLVMTSDRSRAYIGRSGRVTVLRTSDDTIVGEVNLPGRLVAVSPDGSTLFTTTGETIVLFDLSTQKQIGAIGLPQDAASVTLSPDGTRLYAASFGNPFAGRRSELYAVDVAARQIVATATVGAIPPTLALSLAVSGDGSTVYAARTIEVPPPSRVGFHSTLSAFNTAGLTFVAQRDDCASDMWPYAPTSTMYAAAKCGSMTAGSVTTFDEITLRFSGSISLGTLYGDPQIAVGEPACAYEVSPGLLSFGPEGGTRELSIPAPAGCAWTVSSDAPWMRVSTAGSTAVPAARVGGMGPSIVTVTVDVWSGEPRSARLITGLKHVVAKQTQPLVWIDEPAKGSTANQPFTLRGWAIDRDDGLPDPIVFGTGIDAVDVWAYPHPGSGASPLYVGRAVGESRPDLDAAFGSSKYSTAGFRIQVRGLAPDIYMIAAFAHSARTGSFTAASTIVTVRHDPQPVGAIDAPREGEAVRQPFLFTGWAADLAKSSATGVDAVHVWAYPDGGGAPVFVGAARYGQWNRPDVASAMDDAALEKSGYLLLVSGLTPGAYTFVAFAHSTITGAFDPRVVHVNVLGSAQPVIHVEGVVTNSVRTAGAPADVSTGLSLWGLSVDTRAATGVGVAAVHVWAYPRNGGAPVFLGAATPDRDRDISALVFGARFTRSGWLVASALSAGSYQVAIFAQSSVTGTFDNVRVIDVTIR
jgi:hypothetical protein